MKETKSVRENRGYRDRRMKGEGPIERTARVRNAVRAVGQLWPFEVANAEPSCPQRKLSMREEAI